MPYKITYSKAFKKYYKRLNDVEKKTNEEAAEIFHRKSSASFPENKKDSRG